MYGSTPSKRRVLGTTTPGRAKKVSTQSQLAGDRSSGPSPNPCRVCAVLMLQRWCAGQPGWDQKWRLWTVGNNELAVFCFGQPPPNIVSCFGCCS